MKKYIANIITSFRVLCSILYCSFSTFSGILYHISSVWMLEHPYFPMILDTVNAYFNEEYNVGYANRNAIIDIGTMNLKDLAKNSLERRIELQHGIREINAPLL